MQKTKPARVPVWLPYLSKMAVQKGDKILFEYNGGNILCSPSELQSVMIYGDFPPLDPQVITELGKNKVPIIIHRRNVAETVWIHSGIRADQKDLLSLQLVTRLNEHKRRHVARKILEAKFKSCTWIGFESILKIKKGMTVDEMIGVEADYANRYWKEYFQKIGYPEWNRRGDNPVSQVLDAVSKFVSGIVLRWATYHHLSPFHGFLHVPTDYPSLVYDLMEPYRGYLEKVVCDLIVFGFPPDERLLPIAIDKIKEKMDEKIYVDLTRQIVTFQELLHGIVLSLSSYLSGTSSDFMVPIPGKPNGGRPKKINFKMYGRSAGKTDFWQQAKILSS